MLRILGCLFFIFTTIGNASAGVTVFQPSIVEYQGQYLVREFITVFGSPSIPLDFGYTGPGTYVAYDGYRLTSATFSFSAPGSTDPQQTVSGFNGLAPPLYIYPDFFYTQPGTYEIAYSYSATFVAAINGAYVIDEDGRFTQSNYKPSFTSFETGSGTFQFYIAAVPEPLTWAMLLIGFVGIGFAAYRRRGVAQTESI